MKLKVLALFTILIAALFILCALVFNIPLAYIPENSTQNETVMYYVLFLTVEVIVSTFLLMHMLKKSNLDEAIFSFFENK